MKADRRNQLMSVIELTFVRYLFCGFAWLIYSTQGGGVATRAQTTIAGEVSTIDGTYAPGSKVVVLKYKSDEKACETCETKVKRDRTYRIETGLPPGPYTLIAYDGKQYSRADQIKELRRGLNPNIIFTLKSPSAHSRIRGTATDQQGAILSSASITIYLAGCKVCVIDRINTDSEGQYEIVDLPASDKYVAGVEFGGRLLGYKNLDVDDRPEQTVALAFKLLPVSAAVNVTSSEPDTSIDASINIRSLPINSHNFLSLVLISPAISTLSSASGASINGQRSPETRFVLDGVESKDTLASSPPAPISLSAVGQFEFSQTGFQTAQLNSSSGNRIDLKTNSGSNYFHGTLNYELMNDALDARSFFSLPDFDIFRRHRGSASIGGPIQRDKLFFFANYELERGAESPKFSTILTSNISALNQQLIRLGLPAENLRSFVTKTEVDAPVVRLDYQANKKLYLWMTYGFRRFDSRKDFTSGLNGTSSAPSSARDIRERNNSFALRVNLTPSPHLVNEGSYTYTSNLVSIVPVRPQEPSIQISGFALVGRATNLIDGDGHRQSTHVLSETSTITEGRHRINVGGQLDFSRNLFRFAAFDSGRAVIPSLSALSSPVPSVDLFQLGSGGSVVRLNSSTLTIFAHDEFDVRRNLQVNLGLRYKAEFPPSPQKREIGGFQPQVGFSWDIWKDQTTIARAGYSIHRSSLPLLPLAYQRLLGGQALQTTPLARTVISIVGQATASTSFNRFLTTGQFPVGPEMAVIYDPRSSSPTVHLLDVSITRSLKWHIAADFSYSYRRGDKLLTSTNVNLAPPAFINGRADFANSSVNQNFAQIYQFETTGRSSYHGATVTMFRNYTQRFSFNASYTFSKAIDNVPFLRAIDLVPYASFESSPANVFDKHNERAVADWNPAHRFRLWAIEQASRPETRKAGYFRRAVGTLFFSQKLLVESGRYYNVIIGSDANHDGNPLTDRPLNVGRNTFRGQDFIQLDVGGGTNIALSDNQKLKIGIQFFNLLNRSNFASYNTVLGKSDLSGLDPRIVTGNRDLTGFDFRRPLTPSDFGLATSAFWPRRIAIELHYQF